MAVWAHALIKNESRWLWYSVSSIVDHVDKVLLWDTGSTDKSLEIEKEVEKKYPGKIILVSRTQKINQDFTDIRQEMLDASRSDWILVLDGDEIWYDDSIRKVVEEIYNNGKNIESIVVPTINMVGDMFHIQEEKAGRYNLAGKTGHLNLRAFSRDIPGLHAEGGHGTFGWADGAGKRIENRDSEKIKFVNAPYIHTTFLQRSDSFKNDRKVYKRAGKFKYETGENVPYDYYYPEAFFREKPRIVDSPWINPDFHFKFRAFFETPVRKLYRRTLMKNQKYGY